MEDKICLDESPTLQEVASTTRVKPQAREPYDPEVTFEEYHYYANKTRHEELSLQEPVLNIRELLHRPHGHHTEDAHLTEDDFKYRENRLTITDEEWTNASRSVRSASWGACKYIMMVSAVL